MQVVFVGKSPGSQSRNPAIFPTNLGFADRITSLFRLKSHPKLLAITGLGCKHHRQFLVTPPMSLLRPFFLAFAVSSAIIRPSAEAAQTAGNGSVPTEKPAGEDTARVARLILELQDPAFARRQSAASDLLKLDESAAPTLKTAQKTAPREVSERLEAILRSLQQRWFRERLRRFEENADEVNAEDLPGGRQLREVLAEDNKLTLSSPAAASPPQSAATDGEVDFRRILLLLLKSEPDLFAAGLYQPDRLPDLLETRSAALALECDGRQDRAFPTASALSIMLIASQPELRLLRKTSANISRPFEDPRFDRLTQDGEYRAVVRGIVARWIRRPGIAADRPLIFSIRHRLPAGRDVALRVLQGEGRGPQVFYACMCLAALGDKSSIPILESRLESSQVIWPPRGAAPDPTADSRLQVQARDAAMAAIIHLQQIPPESIGLKLLPAWDTLYRIDSVGAISDDIRSERLQRYRALR